jgi:hypothetical protein
MRLTTEYVRSLTLGDAESAYYEGMLSQDQWEAYLHCWQTGAIRFGGLADAYTPHPEGSIGDLARMWGCCKVQNPGR